MNDDGTSETNLVKKLKARVWRVIRLMTGVMWQVQGEMFFVLNCQFIFSFFAG